MEPIFNQCLHLLLSSLSETFSLPHLSLLPPFLPHLCSPLPLPTTTTSTTTKPRLPCWEVKSYQRFCFSLKLHRIYRIALHASSVGCQDVYLTLTCISPVHSPSFLTTLFHHKVTRDMNDVSVRPLLLVRWLAFCLDMTFARDWASNLKAQSISCLSASPSPLFP